MPKTAWTAAATSRKTEAPNMVGWNGMGGAAEGGKAKSKAEEQAPSQGPGNPTHL